MLKESLKILGIWEYRFPLNLYNNKITLALIEILLESSLTKKNYYIYRVYWRKKKYCVLEFS